MKPKCLFLIAFTCILSLYVNNIYAQKDEESEVVNQLNERKRLQNLIEEKERAQYTGIQSDPIELVAPDISKSWKTTVDGNSEFAWDIYQRLKGNGNVFFSPFSISSALAMTYTGAKGKTADEMSKTMHFSTNVDSFSLAFNSILYNINKQANTDLVKVNVANSLWFSQKLKIKNEFTDNTKKYFGSESKVVDFDSAEVVKNEINAWVESKTNKKIQNLILPGVLTELTRFVLVNAIYFKGLWEYPFEASETRKAIFTTSAQKKSEILMMKKSAHYKYYRNDLMQMIEIPYKNKVTSMIVILPKIEVGIDSLEQLLNQKTIADWQKRMTSDEVKLSFPKFKETQMFSLNDVLQEMGIKTAFGDADFGNITDVREIYISHVLHKAFIEVNEVSTEAAAATAVVSALRSLPTSFVADHPFIYLIKENSTGSILFLGRFYEPPKN